MFSQQSIVNFHQSTEQAIWTRQRVGDIDLPHLLENTTGLFGFSKLTSHIKHAFDNGADHSGITENNKFKTIAGYESNVFAGNLSVHYSESSSPLVSCAVWSL
jgi:hypothetical protein